MYIHTYIWHTVKGKKHCVRIHAIVYSDNSNEGIIDYVLGVFSTAACLQC